MPTATPQTPSLVPAGLEPQKATSLPTKDLDKSAAASAAKSGAFFPEFSEIGIGRDKLDPVLVRVIELWPLLSPETRQAILALVEG